MEKIIKKITISAIVSTIFAIVLYYFLKWYLNLRLDSILRLGVNIFLCSLFILIVNIASKSINRIWRKMWVSIFTLVILGLLTYNLFIKMFKLPKFSFVMITNELGFSIFIFMLSILIDELWTRSDKDDEPKKCNRDNKVDSINNKINDNSEQDNPSGIDKKISTNKIIDNWKRKVRAVVSTLLYLIRDYKYVVKRLIYAILGSTGLIGIIVLFYGANFDKYQNYLNIFLWTPIKTNKNSEQLVVGIMALVLILFPLAYAFIKMHYLINLKINLLSEEEINKNYLIRNKVWYQIIVNFANMTLLLIVILTANSWVVQKEINTRMVFILWTIVTVLVMDVIWFFTVVRDWVNNDKENHDSLPRTALIFGLVTAIIAAIIR